MHKLFVFPLVIFILAISSCQNTPDPPPTPADINNTVGYGVLEKLKGIWNGPVTSTTPLGGYMEWIVDFRPISASQISAKNELDTLNDINMSFFIALYNNEYRVAFRNGGSFNGSTRISYFLCDSVSETAAQKYYRFSEIIKGRNRAYCEVVFRNNGDSLYLKTYTNVYNTLPNPVLHMTWSAKRQDTTSCQPAVTQFNFPQKIMTKDFSTSLTGVAEAIFYGLTGDPYPEADQPYLGHSNVSYTYAGTYTPDPAKKVFLIITTQPLISGFSLNLANLKYRSRYVVLSAGDTHFSFNYMHPGSYYLYAIYDGDNNMTASSGDWVSAVNTGFTLASQGTVAPTTQINFTIP
jgi:hypothetical protein